MNSKYPYALNRKSENYWMVHVAYNNIDMLNKNIQDVKKLGEVRNTSYMAQAVCIDSNLRSYTNISEVFVPHISIVSICYFFDLL